MAEVEEVQEIPAYKGTARWFSRGDHFYVVTRTRGGTVTHTCAAQRCRVYYNKKNEELGPVIGTHNHEPTPWVPNRNRMFNILKQRSATESIALNLIYLEEAARYPDAAPQLLFESVVSTMRRCRRAVQPPVPRTIAEYGAALAAHRIHSDMLLATVAAGGASAIILVMAGFRECLHDSNTIIVDGTFRTVPAGMRGQILTIHSVNAGNFFHPAMALMENRTRNLYEAVLQRLWLAAGNPRPDHIVTDFEPALQSALENVTGGLVQGCLFHYVQALLRRARQEGIRVRHGTPGWLLVQLYGALALLPPGLVPLGLAEIPAIAAAEGLPISEAFNRYFQAHWMARVGPARFSVHGKPHLTSNVAESFHASLGRLLGSTPNIWRFTDVAAQIFANTMSRLQAQRAGNLRRRNRVRSYLRATLVADNQRALERGHINIREFLLATARNMVVGLELLDPNEVPDVAVEVVVEAVPQVVVDLDLQPLLEPEVVVDIDQQPLLEPEVVVNIEQQPLLEPEVVVDIDQQPLLEPEVVVNIEQQPLLEPEVVVDIDQQPLLEPEVVVNIEQQPLLEPEVVVDIDQQPLLEPEVVNNNIPAIRCGICLENLPTRVLVPCGHVLCADCLNNLVARNVCPFCRADVMMDIPFYL